MKKLVVFFTLFTFSSVFPQDLSNSFAEANRLYQKGAYQEAITLYEAIEETGKVSSELYFNLGNSYYKINKVGPSIYNYEKALLLNPFNEDASNNLIFAKRLSLDRIEELPKSTFEKLNHNFINKLDFNQWAIISVVLSLLGSLLFLGFYFSMKSSFKRLFFGSSLICSVLLLASLAISFTQYKNTTNTVEAIIYAIEVVVKNEPTLMAEESFILHEGTKVYVLDEVDDWNKIKLADGKIGWLKKQDLNILNDF